MSRQLIPAARPLATQAPDGSRNQLREASGTTPPRRHSGCRSLLKPLTNVSRETLAPATRPPHSQPSTFHSPTDSPAASPANPEPPFRVLRTRPRSPSPEPPSLAQVASHNPAAAARQPLFGILHLPSAKRPPSSAPRQPPATAPPAHQLPNVKHSPTGPPAAILPHNLAAPPPTRAPTTNSPHPSPTPCSEHACAQSSLWLTSSYPNRYPRMRYFPRRIAARPRETVSCSNTQYWGKWLPCHILTT